jgi:AraC-like DNA-binding protein
LTCRTLGEAIACVAEHGQGAGALLHHRYTVEGKLFSIEVTPRLYDTDLEPYLNISERTLRRRLADLNVSYRSLVDQARHERAVDLLRRTSGSLSEIALATGFSDARNFRRAFKRWTGMLPGDFRRGSSPAATAAEPALSA